jgi:DNA polymerase-3 subunit gamma/tau
VEQPVAASSTTSPPLSSQETPSETPKAKSWNRASLGGGMAGIFAESSTEESEQEEPQLVEGGAREDVQFDHFLEVWHALADRQKADNKINLFTLMTSNAPRLEGTRIEVVTENTIQQELLQNSSIDLLNVLRTRLKNFDLHIVGVQLEQSVQRRPYTSAEKYQYMVEKNPILEELKNSFNLGLDS